VEQSRKKKPKILFICIGNMCRSPMAEGFARALGGGFFDVFSAGIHPTGVISEDAVLIMDEKGIDISRQRSKGLDSIPLEKIDIVVSMVGYPPNEVLPADFSGKAYDWDVDDPIGRSIEVFRRVRDEIEEKVTALLGNFRNANYSSSA
jgi:arsenate reductase